MLLVQGPSTTRIGSYHNLITHSTYVNIKCLCVNMLSFVLTYNIYVTCPRPLFNSDRIVSKSDNTFNLC